MASTSDENDLIYDAMYRITAGIPQHELKVMSREAESCAAALEQEIKILEAAAAAKISSPSLDPPPPPSSLSAAVNATKPSQDDVPPKEGSGSTNEIPTSSHFTSAAFPIHESMTVPTSTMSPPTPPPGMPPIPTAIPSAYDPHSKGPNHLSTADEILFTELTPLDRYFCISALLGRLRDPLHTPPPPHSALAKARLKVKATLDKKKKKGGAQSNVQAASVNGAAAAAAAAMLDKYKRVIRLKETHAVYTRKQTDTTALLALWKRISNNRTAAVFRRPVNVKEAPGYDKILFPIDLGLIKKMIVSGYIQTFEELHQKIGMICHNCVLFNGRESDYAILTREFENYVDDSFLDVMQKLKDKDVAAGKK